MKQMLFSLLFVIGMIANANYAIADTTDVNQSLIVPSKNTVLSSFTYDFTNYTDSLTLKAFGNGSLIFTWESVSPQEKYIGIKFKEHNTDKPWTENIVTAASKKMLVEDIEENMVLDLLIGSGNSAGNIVYGTEMVHASTLSETVFKSNQSKGKEEGASITWGIENDLLQKILTIYPQTKYVLKYNTKIGKKQNKSNPEKSPWITEDDISINKVSYKIKELSGGESYVYKIGVDTGEKIIWAKEGKFTAERTWGIFKLLILIGALGMFIFGMKIMSEGLQQAAGSRLRNMLGSITSNRIKGVFTGFGITSVVQSSSVTTVMTVSFVNAGLMTLRQSAGVMMGANIGTTITAWLILLFGFKVSLDSYAFIFIAFGAPLLFFSKGKVKVWANVIIGFSLLFMGLGALKDAVPTLGPDSAIVQFFVDFKDVWYGPVMFVLLGALVTVVIQSSSAAMALTMTLVGGGVIPFEVAAAMILGENIGTTITAELASLIGNVHAKRSARIHSLFNVIGVTWALLLFPYILKGISLFINGDPYTDGSAANTGLAVFHTAFNSMNVILLLPFVPKLVSLAERTVKSKGAADEEFHLDYIGTGMMGTPDLSILEAKKEVAKFGRITSRMSLFNQQLLTEQNSKVKTKLYRKIKKYEEITDRVEVEVANYLAKVSKGEMTEDTAKKVRSMNSIVNDLERIGDIFYQISKSIERKEELKAWFLPVQRASLLRMFKLIDNAFEIMCENLDADWDGVSLEAAKEAEDLINTKRNKMKEEYLSNLNDKDFNLESGMIFSNLFSLCEKAGDHIINVSEAVVGEI
ncbi:Na/Pi cotransporter family protein [Putridiphycobacter roseus]|nr:Na/Pi cotransporter family protein [Putridiphycobacter roseus]